MVNRILLATLALTVAGLMGASQADAQDWPPYRVDIGINAGGTWYTPVLGSDDVAGDDAIRLEPGWLFGTQFTLWPTDRFGIRANGAYTERPLISGALGSDSDTDVLEDINTWSISADLLIRMLDDYSYSMGGIESYPFFAVGLGLKQMNAAVEREVGDKQVTDFCPDGQCFAITEEFSIMGLLGVGTDFRLANNFAIRAEAGTRFWDSKVYDDANRSFNENEELGKWVIEPFIQLGAHLLLGLQAPEVVAVAPPPPEPAPVARGGDEPEAPEEEIVVCVVDPSTPTGLAEVNAIYLPATRDTMVMVDDMRRDFSTVVPRVNMASDTDWFVQGEPLQIALSSGATLEYTTWQSARMIPANQLTYVGMSRGLPVYAASNDVQDIAAQIADARAAAMGGNLDAMMEENAELASAMEGVQYLYVPLRPTGCVFQAVRLIEQVQKR